MDCSVASTINVSQMSGIPLAMHLQYRFVVQAVKRKFLRSEVAMRMKKLPAFIGLPVFVLGVSVAGCSTVAPPKDSIAAAELAIRGATKSKAPEYSPLELRMATDKLDAAKRAMDKKEYTEARRLAEEALVDAQAAEAKAASEDASRAASDLRQGLETLRREAQRASQGN